MRYVIAIYRPKEGKEEEFLGCVRNHVPVLRAEGLVTDREALVFRSGDGTVLEIFEWRSPEAAEEAARNGAVRSLWSRFDDCATVGAPDGPSGAGRRFAPFELIQPDLPYAD